MPVRGVFATVAGATILAGGGMPIATSAQPRKRQGEYLQLAEELQRRNGVPPFADSAEALQAWRDLFDSDEEMEEFGLYIQQMREEERARHRD
jgi:hypothetical protein